MPQAARYRRRSDAGRTPLLSQRAFAFRVDITNSLEEDDCIYRKYAQQTDHRTRTIDICEPFDTFDLWIDPDPNAQLILIW
jgi:hypothetical protein